MTMTMQSGNSVINFKVSTFDTSKMGDEKAQAVKVLEEAAEMFAAWQKFNDFLSFVSQQDPDVQWSYGRGVEEFMLDFEDEVADVIMAACNLVERYDGSGMEAAMKRCEMRNRERGRYK